MVMSLFSVFDPIVMGGSLNWVSMFLVFLVLPMTYFLVGGKGQIMAVNGMFKLGSVFKEISFPNYLGVSFVGVGVFVMISLNNSMGLFPFVFTGTSHLAVTLSVGMVMWVGLFVMGWSSTFKNSSAHLVPEGSPVGLAPFMVIIESVSHLIRPITLSVRLAANMMAGHLIIGLLASVSSISVWGMLSSVLLQIVMLVLELAVAFIQAFVFSVLVILYMLEYY